MPAPNPNAVAHTPQQRAAISKLAKEIETWIRGALEDEHAAFSFDGISQNTGSFYRNFETFLAERSNKSPRSFRFLLDAVEVVIKRGQAAMKNAEKTLIRYKWLAQRESLAINDLANISNIFYMTTLELLVPLVSFAQQNPKLFSDPNIVALQRLYGLFDGGVDFLGTVPPLLTDVTCAVAAITGPAHPLHRNALQRMQDGMRKCFKLLGLAKTAQIFVERGHALQALQKNGYDTQHAMQGLSEVYKELAGPYNGKNNDTSMYFDADIATYAPRGSLLATEVIENFDRKFKILLNKQIGQGHLNNFINHFLSPWLNSLRVETPAPYPLNADFANVLIAHSEALGGSLLKAKRPVAVAKHVAEAPANKAGD